ncbi:MAG: maltose ABC transporter permease MalF [Chloroflexia bacterium]
MHPRQSETRSQRSSNDSKQGGARVRPAFSLRDIIQRIAGLGFIDAIALWAILSLVGDGQVAVAIAVGVVTLFINYIFLNDRLYPIRWLTPGLILMLLMVVYPLIFTVYIALTNYSDGHLLTKEQVVTQLRERTYLPQDAVAYKWTAYRNPAGQFRVILQDEQGNRFLVREGGGELEPYAGTSDLPANLDNFQRIERLNALQYLGQLGRIAITDGDNTVRISSLDSAPQTRRVYSFDPSTDRLTDNQTGVVYTPIRGTFTAPDGKTLSPGFSTVVGFENYTRVLTDPNIRTPFFGVFAWTIIFAFMSVMLTFVVGLGLAIVLNDKDLPLRPLFRSLMIIPYTIPFVISTLIWTGLLNPAYGQFNTMLNDLIGFSPPWFSDGTWAKAGILFVNTWLGFPYMMLLCLGALQAIPTDMYEAANIDGASPWTQFRSLTLPLLLVSIAPLLIGSFAFNFNNFGLIELFNRGGPPIAGVATPAGQTDILISYTYRLAFSGGQGADYGLASAISLFIFLIVAGMTAFNFRFTGQLEEVM